MSSLSSRLTFGICVVIVLGLAVWPAPSANPPTPSRQVFLDRYCVTCHNQQAHVANLILQKSDPDHPGSDPAIWEKVIRKVEGGEMPPAGLPRGDEASLKMFTAGLVNDLDLASHKAPYAGRPVIRRINF